MSTAETGVTAYHHGDVARVILDEAERALAVAAAPELSVRELAKAVGVSHAAPYRHFQGRAGFLAALAGRCLERLVAAQQDSVAAVSDPRERLLRIGEAYVEWGTSNRHAFQLVFDPGVQQSAADAPALATAIAAHRSLLHNAVSDAQSAGILPADGFQTSAAMLWSSVHGLTHLVSLGLIEPGAVRSVLEGLLP